MTLAVEAHLRDLRYFVAVADELSFTRAAELLHISQPSLSKQIRLLERNLGFRLFRRDRRSVALTEAGEALLARASCSAPGSRPWRTPSARLAPPPRCCASGSRPAWPGGCTRSPCRSSRAHVDWQVEQRLHPWSDPTAGLLDESSDVAFLWLPVPGQQRLAHRTLRIERRHVAMCKDHRLAVSVELRIADLLDEPFIALPPSAGVLRDYWLAVEERGGHPIRFGAQAETPDETFEAVRARQGIILLSEGNAELYARPGIVTRPVVDLGPAELAVAWRAGDPRPVIREFGEAARRAVLECSPP